jgi:transposase-like protein
LINLDPSHLDGIDPRLADLIEEHGGDGYRLYLEELRWPGGVECPRCTSGDVLWLERRRRHNCRECKYQFRVTAQTVFHDSHLSLRKWFVAISWMLSEEGVSAARLRQILGGSYKSAWFLEHRIRSALAIQSAPIGPVGYLTSTTPDAQGGRQLSDVADDGRRLSRVTEPPTWPLLRSLIAGGHRHVGLKYLGAYWNEVRWREAQRGNANAFRETVIALLRHPWLPYAELTSE